MSDPTDRRAQWFRLEQKLAEIREFSRTELGQLLGCSSQCHEETSHVVYGADRGLARRLLPSTGCPHRNSCSAARELNTLLVGMADYDAHPCQRYTYQYVDTSGFKHSIIRRVG